MRFGYNLVNIFSNVNYSENKIYTNSNEQRHLCLSIRISLFENISCVCVYQEWRSDNGIWHQVMENFEILFKHIAMNHWRTFFAQSTHHAIFILLRLNHTYEPFILNVYQ